MLYFVSHLIRLIYTKLQKAKKTNMMKFLLFNKFSFYVKCDNSNIKKKLRRIEKDQLLFGRLFLSLVKHLFLNIKTLHFRIASCKASIFVFNWGLSIFPWFTRSFLRVEAPAGCFSCDCFMKFAFFYFDLQ